MIKRICDKCGKEINDRWFVLEIGIKNKSPLSSIKDIGQDKHKEYCEECIKEIKKAGDID